MSQNNQNTVTLKLLGRPYDVLCPPEQTDDLHEAARYLDQVMQRTKGANNIVGQDRLAVISALNIAYELLELQRQWDQQPDGDAQRLTDLQQRIEQTLQDEL